MNKNEIITLPDGSKLELVKVKPITFSVEKINYDKYSFSYALFVSSIIEVNMITHIPIEDRKIISIVRVYNPNDVAKTAEYRALWDTGAYTTQLSNTIVTNLELPQVGNGNIVDAAKNVHRTAVHDCYITPNEHIKTIQCHSGILPRDYDDFDLIIGMDVIMEFKITLENNVMTLESLDVQY